MGKPQQDDGHAKELRKAAKKEAKAAAKALKKIAKTTTEATLPLQPPAEPLAEPPAGTDPQQVSPAERAAAAAERQLVLRRRQLWVSLAGVTVAATALFYSMSQCQPMRLVPDTKPPATDQP